MVDKIDIHSQAFLPNTQQNSISMIYQLYTFVKINSKRNLASTKTKAFVSGSGKKPWQQKGTGRARVGSRRSPLWRGGGVIFGPSFHQNLIKVNSKIKQLALIFYLIQKMKFFSYYIEKDFHEIFLSTFKLKNKLINSLHQTLKNNLIIVSSQFKIANYKLLNLFQFNIVLLRFLTLKILLFSMNVLIPHCFLRIIFTFFNKNICLYLRH